MSIRRAKLISLLSEVGTVLKYSAKKMKVLLALSWGQEVADKFFADGETKMPTPVYSIDKKTIRDCLEQLKKLGPKLSSEHPAHQWLRRIVDSFIAGGQMLLEVETDAFYELSSSLYGNAESRLFNGTSSNLHLSEAIERRLTMCNLNDISESAVQMGAEEFSTKLLKRLGEKRAGWDIRVELTNQIVAKVVAGMNRVRIRKDARFASGDLEMLWNHEIESHCLTAQNGSLQPYCDFLNAGGPRATMTQEGLAVFHEVFGHTMTQRRFLALCDRIHAVNHVRNGANFMELYQWYKERSETKLDAFFNTQRIFRGAKMEGKAPFTKDTVYLGGLIGTYNFLRIAVKNQNRMLVESLVCGRVALEDVGIVGWLRSNGIIDPPRYVPDWLKSWEPLLSFFSLNAVLAGTDLESFQGYFDQYYKVEGWDLSP